MPRRRAPCPHGFHLVIPVEQVADFERCATASGLSIERWIVECAQVQAAAAIDAMQATERRRRNARRSENAEQNAKHRAWCEARERKE